MPCIRLCAVTENRMLSETAAMITIDAGEIAEKAAAGQFVHIKCGEGNLLRRPISIANTENNLLTMVAEARGEGTRWLSGRGLGQKIDVLGPLGNGFDLSGKKMIVVGGGIGVPPMLFASRKAEGEVTAVLGFRDRSCVIMADEFRRVCGSVHISTDDGSFGEKGPVTYPLKRLLEEGGFDAVLACGPKPMLKAVAGLCREFDVPCQVSMEERMGCGIGACLVCACKTQKAGQEKMSHVCKDGPVFNAGEVVW
jgi:dihydroorotate dehydrogenase electron transfer subunit